MSRRNLARIDYSELHSTGTISYQSNNDLSEQLANLSIQENPPNMKASDNVADIIVTIEEIDDTIDENQIQGNVSSDVDATILKLEQLRVTLRRKTLDLSQEEQSDEKLSKSIQIALASVKEYIKTAKEYKVKLNLTQTKQISEIAVGKNRSMMFVIEDIQQNLLEVELELKLNLHEVDDKRLIQINTNTHVSDRLEKISQKYENLLLLPIHDADALIAIQNIGKRYVKLNSLKIDFYADVNKEYLRRELDKDQSSKHINIKLEKFCGYESTTDFYTFRSNFNKVHLKTTPSRYLPDLLKNNYLGDPALTLVKSIKTIDDIWSRLKSAYGDTKIMLSRKIQTLSRSDLTRSRDPEKLVYAISKFTNILREVMLLAKQHKIEENLYYGDALSKIYQQLGDGRLTRFLSSISDEEPNEKQTWERLLTFLEKEEKINQQKLTINGYKSDKREMPVSQTKDNAGRYSSYKKQRDSSYLADQPTSEEPLCQLCGESSGSSEHMSSNGPGGAQIIQYYTCKSFTEMTPAARLSTLKEKGFCFQCLLPGADATRGKHQDGKCQRDYVCPHHSHQRYPVKKHVLVCEEHKDHHDNQEVLARFKARCMRNSNLPHFSKQIRLAFHADTYISESSSPMDDIINKGVYLLQTITVNGNRLNMFYDTGCSDFILSSKAVKLLGSSAIKHGSESAQVGGVGNSVTMSLGSYNVTLPLHDAKTVTLSGVCLDRITSNFPTYMLKEVEREIHHHYQSSGGKRQLPKLPPSVGGEIHLMIGIKYLRYHPKLVHQLKSGLSLYESSFTSSDGGRGVVGGPHRVFTEVHKNFFNSPNSSIFFSETCELLRGDQHSYNEVSLLGYRRNATITNDCSSSSIQANLSTCQRLFEQVESTGCEITYRCPTCRNCKDCKHHEEYEAVSIKEEVEQSIIDSSVIINTENSSTTASLPFIADPKRLANNKDRAMKVYNQQLRKLNHPSNGILDMSTSSITYLQMFKVTKFNISSHGVQYDGGLQLLGSGVQGNYKLDGLVVIHLVKLSP